MNLYYETELYHFGVKGMKWGKRKAQARADYKSARRKALGDYYDKVDPLEKDFDWTKKDGGLSNKAKAGIAKADKEYKTAISKAKSDYKTAKSNIKAEKEAYEKQNPYKTAMKRSAKAAAGMTVTALSATVAGSLLTKKGHDFAGNLLKEGGKGLWRGSIMGLAGSAAVIAGGAAVDKIVKKSKINKIKKNA